jgi:hypothetical protein
MTSVSVPAPVVRLLNAVNSGDSREFLDSFGADPVVDDCGRRFEGLQAIGTWSATELIGDGCRLTVQGVRTKDAAVEIYADLVSTGFNGPTTIVFELADGLVSLMRLAD